MLATSHTVTRVFSARVAIITGDVGESATYSKLTSICGTSISITAGGVDWTARLGGIDDGALVTETVISSRTLGSRALLAVRDSGVYTSRSRVARIYGARIGVVTRNFWMQTANSGVTRIGGTHVLVVTVNIGESTSTIGDVATWEQAQVSGGWAGLGGVDAGGSSDVTFGSVATVRGSARAATLAVSLTYSTVIKIGALQIQRGGETESGLSSMSLVIK